MCALLLCVVKVGEVNSITTFNISGVSSLGSSQILSEYVEPVPTPVIVKKESFKSTPKIYKYRLTSFTDKCVGAGFCGARDFKTNEKGWYLYKGKLVVATATPYMIKTFGYKANKQYFKYYDELILTIDGKKYEAIVLDTCGACYRDERVDLYVKDEKSVIDRGYKGRNMISVEIKKKQ
jgi:3D (Asp-Asp-Asp) domain-containing protein